MSSYDVWDTSNPARGDMAAVRHFADVMNGRATALNDISDRSTRATAATESGGFLGAAGTMWRDVCRATIPPMIDQIVAVLARREAAARGFADIVDGMRASTIHANDLQHKASVARRQYEEMAPDMQGMYPGERLLLQVELDQREARALLHRLREQRAEAEQAFASVLNEIPDVGGVLSKDLMVVGAALPGSMTFADVRAATAVPDAIAATLALKGHYGDPEELAAFEALLSELGDDPAVWNAYYEAIGGEEAMNLVNQLAEANVYPADETSFALAAQIAGELRHGLSRASEDWDQARGEEFAQQMLDGSTRNIAVDIAFFFGDSNGDKMGQSLTVAMATEIDRLERSEDGYDQRRFGLDNGYQEPVIRFAEALADPAERLNDLVFGDPSATVFQTLSKYPDATLEWLQDGPKGTGEASARMEYWFGERDSQASGFLGPVSLLEGVQKLEGGVLSGLDDEVWATTAQIMHDGIHMLTVDNPYPLGDDPMMFGRSSSGASSEAMARVVGNYIAAFAETPLNVDEAGNTDAATVEVRLAGPAGTDVTVANLSREELALFIRGFAKDEGAVALFKQDATNYGDDVLHQMDLHGISASDGMRRIARVYGLADALVGGEAEYSSIDPLETGRAVTDGVFSVVSWAVTVPPGAGEGVSALTNMGFDHYISEAQVQRNLGEMEAANDFEAALRLVAKDSNWLEILPATEDEPLRYFRDETEYASRIDEASADQRTQSGYYHDFIFEDDPDVLREVARSSDEDVAKS